MNTKVKDITTLRAVIQLGRLPDILTYLGLSGKDLLLPSNSNSGVSLTKMRKSTTGNDVDCLFTLNVSTIMESERKFFYRLLRELSPTGYEHEELTLRTYIGPSNLIKIIQWVENDPEPPFDLLALFKKTSVARYVQKAQWIKLRCFESDPSSNNVEITFELNVHPLSDWMHQVAEFMDLLWKETT